MPRITGVNIPENKRIATALTYIFGIGNSLALKILKTANVKPDIKTSKLSETELDKIREVIEKNYKVEGDLKVEVGQNIRRLKEIGSYRGERHAKNLPMRRQKTNARTKRGKKVTVGSGRKRAAEKT